MIAPTTMPSASPGAIGKPASAQAWFAGGERIGYDPEARAIVRTNGAVVNVFLKREGDLTHAVSFLPGYPMARPTLRAFSGEVPKGPFNRIDADHRSSPGLVHPSGPFSPPARRTVIKGLVGDKLSYLDRNRPRHRRET